MQKKSMFLFDHIWLSPLVDDQYTLEMFLNTHFMFSPKGQMSLYAVLWMVHTISYPDGSNQQ
jgi:hypothetical protein